MLSSLERFWNSQNEGSFYVGHASVLVSLDGYRFLIDPVISKPLFLDSWLFFPELVADEKLFEVDGVFISHHHEDHYDLRFLRKLKKGTPIYITEGCEGFGELLEDKTLNVIKLCPFSLNKINEKVVALSIPSDHNSFDSSFLIKGTNFSVYQGNDNFLDKASLLKAKALFGKAEHAYIPYSYVWWYPFCLTSIDSEHRKAEAKRLTQKNMDIGIMMAEIFESDLVIPSAGNLVFYEGAHSILNREVASPFDFCKYVAKTNPTLAQKTQPLLAGDHALKINGNTQVFKQNWSEEEYFSEMEVFLKKVNSQIPAAPKTTQLTQTFFDDVERKLKTSATPKKNIKLYFYRSDFSDSACCIDLNRQTAYEEAYQQQDNSIGFSIQPHAFELWRNKGASAETILNSQRVLVHRNPEVFDPEVWEIVRTCL